MNPGRLARLAVGDFRDRVRRPAYAVILLAAVALGYVATPDRDAQWVIMQIGECRGLCNSAYVGMVTALASSLWLTLGRLLRRAQRDRQGREHAGVWSSPRRPCARPSTSRGSS
ncbi:hypothetical protein LX15_004874 [Streptoalloteichus tenebrarius]|uniref:Transmembrane protein n=1 Tax=Streptoalloteichus tenebrarius (strain ATCC 17920 / DSM 40477 / JCM 4838 / CBS 697.72 / NBRC 16177 / NCIMB 11028 / NRRL B-12390 / A12253. 1 / ISP 5477) TaxID=1933 RepID=A0ABT1I065_STRSD|nr:hypothetical protein [Streptoalloteichus tenebrarius]MCP2261154.1 hypothetical protein [Streptoalloteichus tenebrarius]BFF03933.1 hypothetical protein GCM10020241_56080 [Streptoalloteichus tenebrarius]GHE84919.1 hypothetical protein GCM10018782_65590 [Streptomyces griseoaurantiacus]